MIKINSQIYIDKNEIQEDFVRSSGPGGQNVNKVATAVQLRFDVNNSSCLPDDVRSRLFEIAGRRITSQGILIIDARQFRTQEQNRRDAQQRLITLIQKAAEEPAIRQRTKPTRAAKLKRLEKKRHISLKKSLRKSVTSHDE
ncbi:Peptide chain release factor class I domain-containing protein [Desulfonema limicola]|uniref:Peptide chain release factor class I domain-containing protein n=1 Tax=Desulfonema limicola TaxID=45656 RepID=A0A975BBX0_9BACT|nr:alternative ribosome rescue aminoacyl-tRNA hydrolase ArfB [Desulfonema limicola]QTA82419.1 Peptide chain release factor class I domain-containing protein [Desulfonema limicola]